MKNRLAAAAAALFLSTALAAPASADTLTVTLDDYVYAPFGSGENVVGSFNIGAGSTVTNFAYNVNIFADDPSFLSEVEIYYTDSAQAVGVVTRPGFGDNFPGTSSYSGSVNLVDLGLSFSVGADGLLRIELADSFDDFPADWDAIIDGDLTFTYTALTGGVPEPATWGLMILGFGAVGGAMRRRQSVKADVRFA